MPTRSPYSGAFRRLVLAFDIGTTYSGISYSILDPGQTPEIKGVTRFPAQEQVGGDSKIPTIIYYDQHGDVRAVGAEALKEDLESMIEEEGWTKAEWFKLHLRPSSSASANITNKIPPLPKNKTVLDVFSDFLAYLYKCARSYIEETHANGVHLWTSFQNHVEFILTHPNGWEGAQQAQMRKAAVRAGLIPDTIEGRSRVHFVTEGEASLHFCIQSGLTIEALKSGEGILIVDAGGGTIDITAYGYDTNATGLSFQEIAPPQCFFQGSVFVTSRARVFLDDLLIDSKFAEDVDYITQCFDRTTKLRFRSIKEPQFIKFGTARDKDFSLGIRSGQLKLQGVDIATFFEPSINCILECILSQRENSSKPITSVFLVGGFAASDWLFNQLKDSLDPMGIIFSRPDHHVNKAVANGGVSFYIDHFVSARVAKYAYGVKVITQYDPTDAEHLSRRLTVVTDAAGYEMVPKGYSVILPKATQVTESATFQQSYVRRYETAKDVDEIIGCDLICYRGTSKTPRWMDEEPAMYSKVCTILFADAPPYTICRGKAGKRYYQIEYEVLLNFGLTELTALIQWQDKLGKQKRTPAHVVYDAEIVGS